MLCGTLRKVNEDGVWYLNRYDASIRVFVCVLESSSDFPSIFLRGRLTLEGFTSEN